MAGIARKFKTAIDLMGVHIDSCDASTLQTVGRPAPIRSILIDQESSDVYMKVGPLDTDWKGMMQIIAEVRGDYNPTGFVNRTDSSLSYNESTRELTLTVPSSQSLFNGGRRVTLTSSRQKVHDNSTGFHYYYLDEDNVLSVTTTWNVLNLIYKYPLVAMLYYNATQGKSVFGLGDERHGLMDPTVHEYLHSTFGAQYDGSGLLPFGATLGTGDLDADAQFGITTGILVDEDLRITLPELGVTANKRVIYRYGATGEWRIKSTLDSFPVMQGSLPECSGSRLNYNLYSGGAWTLAEIPDKKVVSCYIFATNSGEFVFVTGQSYYDDKNKLLEAVKEDYLNLIADGLPVKEFVFLGAVAYKTEDGADNTVKARVENLGDGEFFISFLNVSGSKVPSPTTHIGLPGLNGGVYLDGNHEYLIPRVLQTTDPTVNDDIDTYKVGTIWINTVTGKVFNCIDNTNGAAAWLERGGIREWAASTVFWAGERILYRDLEFLVDEKFTATSDFMDNISKVTSRNNLVTVVNSTSHGFVSKDVLYLNGGSYSKAQADASTTLSDPPLIVLQSNDDWFIAAYGPTICDMPSHGLTVGSVYYLSDSTAGALTATEPTVYSNPIVKALTSDRVAVLGYRPATYS